MKKIKNQKFIIIVTVWALAVILFSIFWLGPLYKQARNLQKGLLVQQEEMKVAEALLKAYANQYKGSLLGREEISVAIDEITQLGENLNIEFASIMPKEVESIIEAPYSKLSIAMDLKGEYKKIGLFLGRLNRLEKSLLSISDFEINRDNEAISIVRLQLTAEVYLNDE